MEWYSNVCGKTIKIKSKGKNLRSLTHNEFPSCIRTKHTIQNPILDRDSFNEYVTIHKKIFNL